MVLPAPSSSVTVAATGPVPLMPLLLAWVITGGLGRLSDTTTLVGGLTLPAASRAVTVIVVPSGIGASGV